ncbi:hypothetical protein TNCV_3727591 [Trichonephila clavipes]|uniref:Uncharacterized protein n=1 Tax=Trichonephila clavipes TaxID=2585209 RepID=A0A8X6R9V6_TRICX|nr:hypothetical protein TNCV_3727591 [Trichonephila clavipes]
MKMPGIQTVQQRSQIQAAVYTPESSGVGTGAHEEAVRVQEEAEEPNSNNARRRKENKPAGGLRHWKSSSEMSATKRNINQIQWSCTYSYGLARAIFNGCRSTFEVNSPTLTANLYVSLAIQCYATIYKHNPRDVFQQDKEAAVAQWLRYPTMAGMSGVRSQYH